MYPPQHAAVRALRQTVIAWTGGRHLALQQRLLDLGQRGDGGIGLSSDRSLVE